MMHCPREEELDWAAIRLQRAGIRLLDAESLPAEFQDLAPLLRHAFECVRCGEIIRLLYETEGAPQPADDLAAVANVGRVESPRHLLLPLFPLGGAPVAGAPGPREAKSDHDPAFVAAEEYRVAADSPDSRPSSGPGQEGSLVLTLATQDQRYVVRIFPNQDGAGATAVLVGGEPDADALARAADVGHAGPESSPTNLSLRVSGVDHPFDAKGFAQLAGFPAEEISLIVE